MKHKAHIHNKQPRIYISHITPRSQHRKTNVTSTLPRAEFELHRTEVRPTVRYWTRKKESPPTDSVATTTRTLLSSQQLDTATAVAAATPNSRWNGHDTAGRSHRVPPALSRITAVSRTTERLSHETRRHSHRQHHVSTNGCLHVLHTSFTREEDVRTLWQPQLDCPLTSSARRHSLPVGREGQIDVTGSRSPGTYMRPVKRDRDSRHIMRTPVNNILISMSVHGSSRTERGPLRECHGHQMKCRCSHTFT